MTLMITDNDDNDIERCSSRFFAVYSAIYSDKTEIKFILIYLLIETIKGCWTAEARVQ